MYPNLFQLPDWVPIIGGQPITSFGVMIFLAFLTAGIVTRHEMDRQGFDGDRAWDILFWCVIGGIGGAKLYYLLTHLSRVLDDPLGMLFARGGLTWYGGLILATALAIWKIRSLRLPVGRILDCIAPSMPLAYAVGRMGCFLVGDDYGVPTGSWVGIKFPEGTPPTRVQVLEGIYGITVDPELVARFGEVIPVHPTQLYEIGLSLLVAALIWKLRGHRYGAGWLFVFWLALYAASRFLVEFVRLKDDRYLFELFTSAQLVSVVLFLGSLTVAFRLARGASKKGGVASRAPG